MNGAVRPFNRYDNRLIKAGIPSCINRKQIGFSLFDGNAAFKAQVDNPDALSDIISMAT